MSEPTTEARLTEAHPIWAEGPDCDEQCPGKWSQYHDGFAWGVEKERARIRAAVEARLRIVDNPASIDSLRAVLRIIDWEDTDA